MTASISSVLTQGLLFSTDLVITFGFGIGGAAPVVAADIDGVRIVRRHRPKRQPIPIHDEQPVLVAPQEEIPEPWLAIALPIPEAVDWLERDRERRERRRREEDELLRLGIL